MKNKYTIFVFIYILFFAFKVCAMELNIRSSTVEIERQLYTIFPLGISKDQIILVSADKLKQNSEDIEHHDYGEEPLILKIDGEYLKVYSWVEMNLGEYRSIKRLFIKTTVIAQFYFDKHERLNGLNVEIGGDSL